MALKRALLKWRWRPARVTAVAVIGGGAIFALNSWSREHRISLTSRKELVTGTTTVVRPTEPSPCCVQSSPTRTTMLRQQASSEAAAARFDRHQAVEALIKRMEAPLSSVLPEDANTTPTGDIGSQESSLATSLQGNATSASRLPEGTLLSGAPTPSLGLLVGALVELYLSELATQEPDRAAFFQEINLNSLVEACNELEDDSHKARSQKLALIQDAIRRTLTKEETGV